MKLKDEVRCYLQFEIANYMSINFKVLILIWFVTQGLQIKANGIINEGSQTFEEIESELFYASYCLYSLNKDAEIFRTEVEKIIAEKLPEFRLVDSLSANSTQEFVIYELDDPMNEFPAPDLDYLEFSSHGLSEIEKAELQSPFRAIYLLFSGVKANVISSQFSINRSISDIVKDKEVIIYDDITYETFNKSSWETDRVNSFIEGDLNLGSQIVIHTYRENEYCRAVTLGMEKFSLPDISIQNISCHDQMSYGNLINLIGQTWLENQNSLDFEALFLDINQIKCKTVKTQMLSSTSENADLKGVVKFKHVEPQEGDALNFQVEIVFEIENFSSLQEAQDDLISRLFGFEDGINYIKHNERLLRVSEEAKERLPELKSLFNNGLEPGSSILLKAPFTTDTGGREWMWVEVTKWKNTKIKGILQNDPFEIKGLKSGALVDVNEKDIFDFILYLPDGTSEGNETGKVIEQMSNE